MIEARKKNNNIDVTRPAPGLVGVFTPGPHLPPCKQQPVRALARPHWVRLTTAISI